MADIITLYGDRKKWISFTSVVKLRKRRIWEALLPFLEQYVEDYKKEGDEKDGESRLSG